MGFMALKHCGLAFPLQGETKEVSAEGATTASDAKDGASSSAQATTKSSSSISSSSSKRSKKRSPEEEAPEKSPAASSTTAQSQGKEHPTVSACLTGEKLRLCI